MPHATLTSIGDTRAAPFGSAVEPHLERLRARAATVEASATVATAAAPGAAPLIDCTAVAERFCGALAVSALLGMAAAPLVAHGAAAESGLALASGLCCAMAAALIQLVERRRVTILLVEAAIGQGMSPAAARQRAREQVKAWLG